MLIVKRPRLRLMLRVKKIQAEINQKRDQLSAENGLRRQKMLVESNAALEKDKLQADLKRDTKFQQVQQKERDRAMAAQRN